MSAGFSSKKSRQMRRFDELYLFSFRLWMKQTHPWFYRIKFICIAILSLWMVFTIIAVWVFPGLWFRMAIISVFLIISYRLEFRWLEQKYMKEYAKQ